MSANYRKERIERLLEELRYEITRGMMEGEIEEEMGFQFIVPASKMLADGIVNCEFRCRPQARYLAALDGKAKPKLGIVK